MTTFDGMDAKSSWQAAWDTFMREINGRLHEISLWIYAFIVVAHWLEHLFQAFQIYVMGWARPDAKGLLGLWMPTLVTSEALHFGYAVFMLLGLAILRPGFYGRSRVWWNVSLAIQGWHFIEHAVLQWQAIFHQYLFDAAMPTSILQVWVPRVELHLFYNAAVTIPMLVAMFYHRYPPKGEIQHGVTCTCAVRRPEYEA